MRCMGIFAGLTGLGLLLAGCGSTNGGGSGSTPSDRQLTGLGGELTKDSAGNIVEADFSQKPVSDADLAVIARHASLQKIWLTRTGVTDAGLIHLQTMPRLQELGLAHTSITDAGLKHLAAIKTLRKVYIFPTKVTDSAVDELKAAVPGLVVVY